MTAAKHIERQIAVAVVVAVESALAAFAIL